MNFLWFVFCAAVVAIVFAISRIFSILRQPEGSERMKEIARFISEGALAYLKQQYRVVGRFFAGVFIILVFLAWRGYLDVSVPGAFLASGFFSALCGWFGMWISTRSSARTCFAAKKSLNAGLKLALSSGAVMGLLVVGLGLIFLAVSFLFLWIWYQNKGVASANIATTIASTMLMFGMGASFYALFARVGGGIYTKAADVGADIVGKVEANIPEDDPRNPAVIADQVGDNVGDVAGMGADLYESYIGSIIAAMALAYGAGLGFKGVALPLIIAAAGAFAAIIGFFMVRIKEGKSTNLLWALRKGIFGAAIILSIGSFFIVRVLLPQIHMGVWVAIISGLISGLALGVSTEYFTSAQYRPTRNLSKLSLTGPATVVIGGISLGMFSVVLPVCFVSMAVLVSFYACGGSSNFGLGLYGIGIAAVGMLSTLGITLATDAYGPVADNAGGNAEMSGLGEAVRNRTDQLDALGNTTAATGKGFAIGSACLTALALIVAYKQHLLSLGKVVDLNLLNPRLLIGLFIGAMTPFVFCSLTLKAVGEAAFSIVEEVRRQFREIKGLLEGTQKADYSTCVRITTKAAQAQMLLPSSLAIVMPIVVGILLGIDATIGFLLGALVSGFVLAVMMANAGGAWDNAKKYIEEGNLGGKGSDAHKAAVVGDTVGDPFKDTSGPSLNILIKLMSMVSIVFSQFIIQYSLFK